jgi:hypothetical protein
LGEDERRRNNLESFSTSSSCELMGNAESGTRGNEIGKTEVLCATLEVATGIATRLLGAIVLPVGLDAANFLLYMLKLTPRATQRLRFA